MLWSDVLSTVPLMIAANTATIVALVAWRRREAPSAHYFALLMLAVAQWSVWSALSLGSRDHASALLCTQIQYLGIGVVPVAWLGFATSYTGRHSLLSRRRLALVSVIPAVTALLAWTNGSHHLMWSEFAFDSLGQLTIVRGPWFFVHSVYSYSLILIGTFMLCEMMLRSARIYREQGAALVIGATIPLLANTLQMLHIPYGSPDLTPYAFTLSGLAFLWGVFRFRVLEMLPVAHEIVLRDLRDAIIVLDPHDRICDLNLAAQSIFEISERDAVGQPVEAVFAHQAGLPETCIEQFAKLTPGPAALECLITADDGSVRYYDVHIHPLEGRTGASISRAITMRDVTERKLAEAERQQLISQLEQALHNVRALKGLLPICTNCKKIRNDQGYWTEVESYIASHSEADFTHGLCPECIDHLYPDLPADEEKPLDDIWNAG